MSEPISQDEISGIKKRINEIGFAPLEEHGKRFDEINQELSQALSSVEDRKSTRLNSSHEWISRMPSSA